MSERPDIAYLAVLHALTLKVFYSYAQDSCLELDLRAVSFPAQTPGLTDSAPANALRTAHENWDQHLPGEPEALWETLAGWDQDSRDALFAYVVSHGVNAVVEPYSRRPRAIAHADKLAQAVDLDVAATGWTPTADTFLGRVTRARILAAVAEAKGQRAADRIERLKKGEMVEHAAELLAGTGWIPEPLRTPGRVLSFDRREGGDAINVEVADAATTEPAEVVGETAEDGGETAMGEDEASGEDAWAEAEASHAVAAE